jgi:YVTN family beta-propeller protein
VVGSPIPLSTAAVGVAAAPDSSKVYVATAIRVGRGTGGVSVIDTATNTVIATILIDRVHNGVAVTPDGSKVYVAGSRGRFGGARPDSVCVIDPVTNAVIATVPVGFSPFGVAVVPDGSKVYVANSSSNTVSVIDAVTNAAIATVPVGLGAAGVAVTPDGNKVYVANEGSNTVSVIDTATNTVSATIPVGLAPSSQRQTTGGLGLAVPADRRRKSGWLATGFPLLWLADRAHLRFLVDHCILPALLNRGRGDSLRPRPFLF